MVRPHVTKLLAVWLTCLILAGVAGISYADDDTGILTATIQDATDQSRLSNADVTVRLLPPPGTEGEGRTFKAVTGVLGMFKLKGLPPGSVEMTASKKGYLDGTWLFEITAGGRTEPGCLALIPEGYERRTVLVIEGDPCGATAELDGRMLRVLPGTGSEPRTVPMLVEGVSVGTHTVRADKDGYEQEDYEVDVLERTPTRLLIDLDRQKAVAAWFPGGGGAAAAIIGGVALVASGSGGGGPAPTYTIAGHVLEQGTGDPIAGVEVRVGNSSTTTNGQGAYSVAGLPAGTYEVTPELDPWTFAPTSRSVPVNADTGNVSDADFVGSRPADLFTICGTVGEGYTRLGGVAMALEPMATPEGARPAQSQSTTTAGDGSYCFTELPAGQYRVYPTLTEYTFSPAERTPTVNAQLGSASEQNFTGTRNTYTISGQVYEASAGPETGGMEGVTVALAPVTSAGVSISQTEQTTTGAGGLFSFTVFAGQYTIGPTFPEYTFDPPQRTSTVNQGTGNSTGNDFGGTPNTYSVSGTVRLGEGGLSGVQMTLEPVGAAAGVRIRQQQTVTTAADGTYSFDGLLAGQYRVWPTLVEYAFDPAERTPTVNETLGSASDQDFDATLNTYSISGTVRLSSVGFEGVEMTLEQVTAPEGLRIQQQQSVATGVDGTYSFTGLPAGQYRVTPTLAEYTFTPTERTPTVNQANGDATGQDFTATLGTYSISGTVWLGETGLSDVELELEQVTAPEGVRIRQRRTVTSDAQGQYTFNGLPAGQYRVTPKLVEYTFDPAERTPTVNQALGSATDQDFTATQNTYSISGTAWLSGEGFEGVEMTLEQVPAPGSVHIKQQQSVTTDADGTYSFTGLPAGQYRVTPTMAEYTFSPAERTPTVNQANGDATGQDFVAALRLYSISGTVSLDSAGLAGVEMSLEAVGQADGVRIRQTQTITTGTDGFYEFTGLVAGQYRVTPALAEYTFDPIERTPEVNDTLGNATGQDFVATRRTYSISGTVYLQASGLGGVEISLEPASGVLTAQAQTVTTASDGSYSFTGLMSGQYRVVPTLNEYTFTPTERTPTVNETLGDATGQDFTAVLRLYSISGTVSLGGSGFGGVEMSLETVGGAEGARIRQTQTMTTGTDGFYEFTGLVAGQYRVWPTMTEYSFSPTERTPTVKQELGNATGQDFTATLNTYSISGTVTCNSVGVGGVSVFLDNTAGDTRVRTKAKHDAITTTAADGTYSFGGYPAGEYLVVCSDSEYTFDPMERTPTVNKTLGNATGQDFAATRKTYTISGTVLLGSVGLSGVTISLEPVTSSARVRPAQTTTTTTITDGSYSFTGLVSGQYRVWPTMSEYTFTPTERTPTVNAPNGDATGQDFVATLNTYSISGTVTLDGSGLSGVDVYIDPVVGGSGVGTRGANYAWTTTGPDGTYSLAGLVAGQYRVWPELDEHVFSPTERTPTVNQTIGSATGQDFTATVRTYSISGTVSLNSAGLSGVSMSVAPYTGTTSVGAAQTQTITTGTDGSYEFTGLAAGQYRVWPTLTEYTFNPTERTPTVNENLGNATGQDFAATQNTYSISGTVTLAGDFFSGVTVSLEPAAGSSGVSTAQPQTTVTITDGSYSFTGLTAGQYRVWPTLTEYTFAPAERTPTVNVANGDATGQDFAATLNTYSISGTITLGGVGLGSVPVYLDPVVGSDQVDTTKATYADTITAADGTYSFTGLLAGQYRVWPLLSEYIFDPTERTPTVNETNGNATGQDFVATLRTYSISGTLYYMQPGTQTLPGFTVELYTVVGSTAVSTADAPPDYTTTADESGDYTFTGLPPGQYRVVPAAYYGWFWNPTELLPTVNSTLGDATDQGFTANHETPSGCLEGQVLRADGQGACMGTVVTARLSMCGNRGPSWTGTADSDGLYFIYLPFGMYTLTPALPGWTFDPVNRTAALPVGTASVGGQDFDGTQSAGSAGTTQAGFVTSMACVQTRAGTAQICFGLTADASVTAEVLNIAGRKVRLITTNQAMEAGVGTLLWDGRNANGAAVPSGMYLIRLTVHDASGTQSQAVGRVNIIR